MIVEDNVTAKQVSALKLQECVRTDIVSKGGWRKLVVKNVTMVPTALIVKAHARHVKTRLVKDLKEIVQMDVLKTSRDINVNFQ